MTKEKKEAILRIKEMTDQWDKGFYGLDPEMSLLSVNFANAENSYLNEHYQNEAKDEEN